MCRIICQLWPKTTDYLSHLVNGGSKGVGRRDVPPPPPRAPKFFRFYAVFGKIWQNRMLAPPWGVGAPLGKSWIRRWFGVNGAIEINVVLLSANASVNDSQRCSLNFQMTSPSKC